MVSFTTACRRPAVRDLGPQAEFYQALLAERPSRCGDAEAWLAAQHDGLGAPGRTLQGAEWLLAEGCEDCVRDLATAAARRAAPVWQ